MPLEGEKAKVYLIKGIFDFQKEMTGARYTIGSVGFKTSSLKDPNPPTIKVTSHPPNYINFITNYQKIHYAHNNYFYNP